MRVAQAAPRRPTWRFRRCPGCGSVDRASAFTVAQSYRPGWSEAANMRRRCPDCGHTGPTWTFRVVREQHTAGGARE
jgi:hypothetical protein